MDAQHYEAERLRKRWEDKGNPPCEHSQTQKEIMGYWKTGDLICMTCGLIGHPSEFKIEHPD